MGSLKCSRGRTSMTCMNERRKYCFFQHSFSLDWIDRYICKSFSPLDQDVRRYPLCRMGWMWHWAQTSTVSLSTQMEPQVECVSEKTFFFLIFFALAWLNSLIGRVSLYPDQQVVFSACFEQNVTYVTCGLRMLDVGDYSVMFSTTSQVLKWESVWFH